MTPGNTLRPTDLLTSGEVAALLRVTVRTPARWARSGDLPCILTPGGHRRYYYAAVKAFMDGGGTAGAKRAHNAIVNPTPNPTT